MKVKIMNIQLNGVIVFLMTIIMFSFCLNGCITATQQTPEQRLFSMYSIYNAQYADYQSMTSNPESLSLGQKIILKEKKRILFLKLCITTLSQQNFLYTR